MKNPRALEFAVELFCVWHSPRGVIAHWTQLDFEDIGCVFVKHASVLPALKSSFDILQHHLEDQLHINSMLVVSFPLSRSSVHTTFPFSTTAAFGSSPGVTKPIPRQRRFVTRRD